MVGKIEGGGDGEREWEGNMDWGGEVFDEAILTTCIIRPGNDRDLEAHHADFKTRTEALRAGALERHQALEDASISDKALIETRLSARENELDKSLQRQHRHVEELSAEEREAQKQLAQAVADAVRGMRGRMEEARQRVEAMGRGPAGSAAASDKVYVPGVGWLVPQTSEHDEDDADF